MGISGQIIKIFADKTTWASILLQLDNGETIKAAGKIYTPTVGAEIVLEGEYIDDPKYGRQFKVSSSKMKEITTIDGVLRYLTGGLISGIGETIARMIVKKFGMNTLKIIETDPMRLTEIPGIGEKRARLISESHKSSKCYLDLVDLLGNDATEYQIRTIYEKYAERSVAVIKKNPYQLIYDIEGFGFKKADKIAIASGIQENDPRRTAAAITFSLREIANEGHVYCMLDSLEAQIEEKVEKVNIADIGRILGDEIDAGRIVLEDGRVYTSQFYNCEKATAKCVGYMLKRKPAKTIPKYALNLGINKIESESGFQLEKRQKDAVFTSLNNRLSVITGGPGTGKTTIIKTIIEVWNDDLTVRLAAPTGKAAQRISEAVDNRLKASTIHRLLEQWKKDPLNTSFFNNLIIVDEASMIDITLAAPLMNMAVKTNSNLILIGDIYQLPPIGPGLFFRDLVVSPCVPTTTLELSHRQHGKIAINAERIKCGEGIHSYAQDDTFQIVLAGKDVVRDKVIEEYMKLAAQYPIDEICCVVPMRKKGKSQTASETLNEIIREKVNPAKPGEVHLAGCPFRKGDRIMQTGVNDYSKNVFNGDCGTVDCLDAEYNLIYVNMDDGRRIEFKPFEMSNFTFAYAMTIHKSQGSEYRAVIVVQSWEHYMMLQRNLLYTAITRAKDKVVLIGEAKAVNVAVRTSKSMVRNTILRKRIGKEISA